MLLIAVLEFGCYLGMMFILPAANGAASIAYERSTPNTAALENVTPEVHHPYLGWVLNPRHRETETFEGRKYPINEFGLIDFGSPIRKRASGKVIVAVAGGSVAWHISAGGNEALARELQRQKPFQGKKVEIVRLAMSGYKQPQQLLLLTYLLSLGAEFDYVINIDGYNELVLHPVENVNHDVFPAFPRAWKARNRDRPDASMAAAMAKLTATKAAREKWRVWCNSLPFQSSSTVNFLWKARDRYLRSIEYVLINQLLAAKLNKNDYQITGPQIDFKTEAEMHKHLVKLWQDSSRQMFRLCQANKIEYLHILPPNQYLKNSKPMGKEEADKVLLDYGYGPVAESAYPQLVSHGKELKQEGLPFFDLTQAFAEHSELLYVDTCCHYNPTGNEIVATAIANIMGSSSP